MRDLFVIVRQRTQWLRTSAIWQVLQRFFSPDVRVLSFSLLFYASLYFSTSNRTLLILSVLFGFALYTQVKNVQHTLFLLFLATLPFAKGKGFQIFLLAKEDIQRNPLFDLTYFFPLYLSDFYLLLFLYMYLRQKLTHSSEILRVTKRSIGILFTASLFILATLLPVKYGIFPEVILLSTIQIIKMVIILFIPLLSQFKKIQIEKSVIPVMIASVLFQVGWVGLQRVSGGALGKDIEVYLPGQELGIRSSENVEIFRSTGTFYEPSILGTFLLMHLLFFSYLLMKSKPNTTQKLIYQITIIGILITLVFTGSRAIYGFTALSIVLLLVSAGVNLKKLLGQVPKSLLITFVIISVAVVPYLINRFSSITDVFSKYGSGTYRLQLMQYAVRLASSSPFGIGVNLSPYYFATAFPNDTYIFDPTRPHNLFFQLLAETGIIGVVLFSWFIWKVFAPIFRSGIKKYNFNNSFAVAALGFLLCAQFYPIFINHTEIISFFFLYAGFAQKDWFSQSQ